jgi:hypothetical protein
MSIDLRCVDLDDSFTCIVGSNGCATANPGRFKPGFHERVSLKQALLHGHNDVVRYDTPCKQNDSVDLAKIQGALAEKDLARRI